MLPQISLVRGKKSNILISMVVPNKHGVGGLGPSLTVQIFLDFYIVFSFFRCTPMLTNLSPFPTRLSNMLLSQLVFRGLGLETNYFRPVLPDSWA